MESTSENEKVFLKIYHRCKRTNSIFEYEGTVLGAHNRLSAYYDRKNTSRTLMYSYCSSVH